MAEAVDEAVERAGVYFIGWESSFRVQTLYQQVNAWMNDGRLGDPLAVYCYFRAALPDIAWFGLAHQFLLQNDRDTPVSVPRRWESGGLRWYRDGNGGLSVDIDNKLKIIAQKADNCEGCGGQNCNSFTAT